MKFLGAGIALTYMAASVAAFQNLETADKQLNISSPLVQGNYVAGQMLPLIYIPTGNPPNLVLNVYLESVGGLQPETPLALNADVSANDVNSVPVVVDGIEYRQHSINYPIPQTTPSGSYNVVFQNTLTQTNTTIPVTVNPYIPSGTAVVSGPPATATSINLSQPSSSA